jgi:hypothetical protein
VKYDIRMWRENKKGGEGGGLRKRWKISKVSWCNQKP